MWKRIYLWYFFLRVKLLEMKCVKLKKKKKPNTSHMSVDTVLQTVREKGCTNHLPILTVWKVPNSCLSKTDACRQAQYSRLREGLLPTTCWLRMCAQLRIHKPAGADYAAPTWRANQICILYKQWQEEVFVLYLHKCSTPVLEKNKEKTFPFILKGQIITHYPNNKRKIV